MAGKYVMKQGKQILIVSYVHMNNFFYLEIKSKKIFKFGKFSEAFLKLNTLSIVKY